MGTIYLIRHGQASFGHSNYDQLSKTGFEQARVLGEHLRGRLPEVDAVYLGTMRRHRETAETCLAAMGRALDFGEHAGFNEYDHEEVVARYEPRYSDKRLMQVELAQTGDPKRAFQALFAKAIERWVGGEADHEYSESWSGFKDRCAAALDSSIAQLGPSRTALVFTSGGVISALAQRLLGIPDSHLFALNWNVVNASISKLIYGGRGVSLSSLNEHAHFEGAQSKLMTYR
ncbi:MAG: histidine phosphatase family protein [Stagnimonas sp.]|nr:histidine phosphatase family protein [Stagnimonas sp.]